MEEKQKFICSYCGAEYDAAPARARCELECNEKRKQAEGKERKERLEKERAKRLAEIDAVLEQWAILVRQYQKDYGEGL